VLVKFWPHASEKSNSLFARHLVRASGMNITTSRMARSFCFPIEAAAALLMELVDDAHSKWAGILLCIYQLHALEHVGEKHVIPIVHMRTFVGIFAIDDETIIKGVFVIPCLVVGRHLGTLVVFQEPEALTSNDQLKKHKFERGQTQEPVDPLNEIRLLCD